MIKSEVCNQALGFADCRKKFRYLITNQKLNQSTATVDKICIKSEPVHEISNNVVCVTSKASDQPAHTRSLIRGFASRLSILWLLSYCHFSEHHLEFLSFKGGCTCQNTTLLEISCHGSDSIYSNSTTIKCRQIWGYHDHTTLKMTLQQIKTLISPSSWNGNRNEPWHVISNNVAFWQV